MSSGTGDDLNSQTTKFYGDAVFPFLGRSLSIL